MEIISTLAMNIQKKKILIIATEINHFPLYYELIHNLLTHVHIDVVTNQKLSEPIINKFDSVTLHLAEIISFRYLFNIVITGKYDVVIVDEIYGNPIPYCALLCIRKTRKIYIVHNVRKHLFNHYTNPIQFTEHVLRMVLFRFYDAYYTVGKHTYNYLRGVFNNVFMVPFNYHYLIEKGKQYKASSASEKIRIIVPGRTDQIKRDYLIVLDAIILALLENNLKNITVEIIGKATTEFLNDNKDKLDKINESNSELLYFNTEYISENDFYSSLLSADFMLDNLMQNTFVESVERYGETKESGLSYFIDLFGTNLIYRNDFLIVDGNDKVNYKYDSTKTLSSVLQEINNNAHQVISRRKNTRFYNPLYIDETETLLQESMHNILY